MTRHTLPLAALACLLALSAPSKADDPASGTAATPSTKDAAAPEVNVFEIPALFELSALLQMQYGRHMDAGNFAKADAVATNALDRLLGDAGWRVLHARALARLERTDEALAELEAAIDKGFRASNVLRGDKELVSLRDNPRFVALLEKAGRPAPSSTGKPEDRTAQATPQPLEIGTNLVAYVTVSNTAWDARSGLFQVHLKPATNLLSAAELAKRYRGPAADVLRPWLADGRAAGNSGDLYENRDGAHSRLDTAVFPGLSRVVYGTEATTQHVDRSLARTQFSLPTLGNASLASTAGPAWRSLPRFSYIEQPGAARMAMLFFTNQLYFYPEHRDHDPENGDVYPANTPYVVISQGSSGSDQPFLRAMFGAMAALQPKTKQFLIQQRHLMPTLQMLLRSTQRGLEGPDAYFTGKAHPVVFDAEHLDAEAMIRKAQSLAPGDIVPVPILRVIDETKSQSGIDYFDTASETLFDTPCAVARVARNLGYTRRMSVAATPAMPLPAGAVWRWALLQGDPSKVRIAPSSPDGATVALEIDYHDAINSAAAVTSALASARVDIGCFLKTTTGVSAPAFISVHYLRDEVRVYSDDANKRLLSVDYTAKTGRYVDPLLTAKRDWRDEYRYSPDGRLRGWTRIRKTASESFTSDGQLIRATNADGDPTTVQAVTYRREPPAKEGGMPTLVQTADEPR